MLYATGLFVPDPFIYLRAGTRPIIVLSDLEIDRARKQASHCRVASLSAYQQKLRRTGVKSPRFAHVIREILRENKIRRASVPDNFPLGLARELKKLGIKLKPRTDFFPKREIKSADEVRKISAALVMAEVGMAEGMQALRLSKIDRRRQLIYQFCRRAVWRQIPSSPAANKVATRTSAAADGCAQTSRSSLIFFRARKKPAILATSRARSCADTRVKPCGNFTTPFCTGKKSRCKKSAPELRLRESINAFSNFSRSGVTRPAGATGGWRDFFTAPDTDSAWRFTNHRAWVRLPRAA